MEKRLTKAQRKDRRNRNLCKLVKENDLCAENRLLMENEMKDLCKKGVSAFEKG